MGRNRARGTLKDLNWKNLHVYIARKMNPEESQEYQKLADEIYGILIHLADMFWDEYQEICGAQTHPEIKKTIQELSQTMSKDSLSYMFIAQGAKQFMFPGCKRGRGILKEDEKQAPDLGN